MRTVSIALYGVAFSFIRDPQHNRTICDVAEASAMTGKHFANSYRYFPWIINEMLSDPMQKV